MEPIPKLKTEFSEFQNFELPVGLSNHENCLEILTEMRYEISFGTSS